MKAKFYYQRLLECNDMEQVDAWLEATIRDFDRDTIELIRIRCAKTRQAVISIIREVNQKWEVLVKLVDNGSANATIEDEKYFLRGFRLQPDGYKACFVHNHPEYAYAFDLDAHKKKVEQQQADVKKNQPKLFFHPVKPWEEITMENIHEETIKCMYALGSYAQIGFPVHSLRPLAYRIDVLRKWADNKCIDLKDVEEYERRCKEMEDIQV